MSKHWQASDPALPPTPAEVRTKLIEEGVRFEGPKASQEQRWSASDWVSAIEREATSL